MITFEFANEIMEYNLTSGWIVCKRKNVRVFMGAIKSFLKGKHAHGEKQIVGQRIVYEGNDQDLCYMWRDEFFTHIGCLKEKTTDFNKKYIDLIKQINNFKSR